MLYRIKSLAMMAKYRLFPSHRRRTQEVSMESYEKGWAEIDPYFTELKDFTDRGKPIKLTTIEFKRRVVVDEIARLLEKDGFESVLEIGCGAGLNLFLLAKQFPEVTFAGIEPTENGVVRARELTSGLKNVQIKKGSILDKAEGKYDLVFTSAVLEQLHLYLDMAFRNIFDIPAKRYLFYESWIEGIEDDRFLFYQLQADYFRESKNTIKEYGAREVAFKIPDIQPAHMRYSVLTAMKP